MDTEPNSAEARITPSNPTGFSDASFLEGNRRAPRASGLRVRLTQQTVRIPLRPARPFGTNPDQTPAPWHYVQSEPGTTVSVISESDQTRVVRLTLRSQEPGWRPRWIRWSYAIRKAPDIEGGQTLDAQDRTSPDESALDLLLLPGETRTVTLEFLAKLDGETRPGNYSYELVASDTQTGEEALDYGMLLLRHPRAGLLDHLPSLYAEACGEVELPYQRSGRDDSGADSTEERSPALERYIERTFFERFLRGFEDCMEPMQERIAQLYRRFDSNTTPADFLPWLATWVALVLDENWPELKRRQLIREAVELYRWRGTRRGMSRYLQIYTGVIPQINDRPYEGMRLGPNTLLGRDTVLGGVGHHCFLITLALPANSPVSERAIQAIIESEKPAHTAYELRILSQVEAEI